VSSERQPPLPRAPRSGRPAAAWPRRLAAVRRAMAELARQPDLSTLLALLPRRAAGLLGASCGFLFLCEPETGGLVLVSSHGLDEWIRRRGAPSAAGLAGLVAARRQGLRVPDYATCPHALPEALPAPPVGPVMAQSLLCEDRLVGVVALGRPPAAPPFTPAELELLGLLADRSAAAIQEARPPRGEPAEPRHRIAAHADLTFRQREEVFCAVIGASPLPIIATDAGGRVRLWSPAAERLFGWTEAEALGGLPPSIPPGMVRQYQAILGEVLRGHELVAREVERLRKSGEAVPVGLSAAPIRDAAGQIAGAVCILTDLTARKEMESQLLHAHKMQALGRMASSIAHDFNNHLLAIMGSGELLRADLADCRGAAELVDEILEAGGRATDLVRRLLLFSRRQLPQPKPLHLNGLLGDLRWMLERLLGEHILLRLELDAAPDTVHADPGQLEQVILNLVINAREAMEGQGTLTLRTETLAAPPPHPAPGPRPEGGPTLLLSVRDTGCGMDEATQQRIFEPFFTTKQAGTGIGLAAVHIIVEHSGGAIWVESSPGRGAVFNVCLPLVEAPDGRAAATPAGSLPRGRETILVAEDAPAARRLVVRVLRRLGYTVLEAAGGPEALALARSHDGPLGLLLTDMNMPQMNGLKLTAALRGGRPDLPVLLISGYPDDAKLSAATPGSGFTFLAKPFTPVALAEAVRGALDAGRARPKE